MIVCHCQEITDHQIRAAVDWMRAADPYTVITAGKIYHALGKRADCGSCMPLFLDSMRLCESFKIPFEGAVPAPEAVPYLGTRARRDNEGRQEGHRVSERGSAL